MSNVVRSAFTSFGTRLLASLKSRKTEHAVSASKVGGKTLDDVIALVNQFNVGLNLVYNAPVATKTEAEAGTSGDRYLTPLTTTWWLDRRLAFDSAVAGNVFAGFTATGASTGRLCQRLGIVTSDTELSSAVQNYKESFSSVFNNWTRISHGSNGLYPSKARELNAWSYDSVNDAITCTMNSDSMIGFISPDAHENFDFEVEVSSTYAYHNWIGVVIAFAEEGGRQYTLNLWRAWGNRGASDPNFALHYNQAQTDAVLLAGSQCGLPSPSPYHYSLGSLGFGWDRSGPVRLKVKREGNLITCWTTAPGALGTYLTAYPLTIDLDSQEILKKFKGPQRFGYFCIGQNNSTWKSLTRPGDRVPIVDARNRDCYVYQNGAWVKQPINTHRNYLAKNRFFTNQITGKLFFVGDSLDNIYAVTKGS